MPTTHKLIAAQTLGSTAGSVTFSAIPSSYSDLKILFSARSTWDSSARDIVRVRLNGTSDTNHTARYIWGDGSGIIGGGYTFAAGGYIAAALSNANTFSNSEVYILNYTSTSQNKVISTHGVEENATATASNILAGSTWASTSVVTSVSLGLSVGSFVANSSFYLYGIARA